MRVFVNKLSARRALAVSLVMLLALVSNGCLSSPTPTATMPPLEVEPYTDRAKTTRLYDMLEIGQTRAEIVEKLGSEGEELQAEGGPFTQWVEDGVGVAAVFWPDGTLRGKTLYSDDVRQFHTLTGSVDLSVAVVLTKNMAFSDARYAIGIDHEGIEIACVEQDETGGAPMVIRVMVWVNEDGSMLELNVNEDRVVDIKSYIYGEEEEA